MLGLSRIHWVLENGQGEVLFDRLVRFNKTCEEQDPFLYSLHI